ncbi:MAG: TonB-dependent receptor [Hyphomicrobiaceae bacterium]
MADTEKRRHGDAGWCEMRNRMRAFPMTRVVLVSGLGGACLASAVVQSVHAQSVTAQAVQLPPVVVEGGTLVQPKVMPSPKKPAVEEAAGGAQKSKKSKTAKKKPQSAEDAIAGQPPVAPASADVGEVTGAGAGPNAGVERGVLADTLGTAVSVVTREEIQASQSRAGADVLRGLPGVSVSQQGGVGNVAVVRMRGAESNHTLVLIDGVEVNSGIDGFYDFANLATDDIARIEVLRGPQSGLYGSGALGGVVNIITQSGKGPARVVAEAEGGSFNTRGGRAGVSGGTDTAWGAFMVASRHTDGFNIAPKGNERDGSELNTLSMKGGVKPIDGLTLSGSFRASRLETEYDGFDSVYLPDGLPALGYVTAIDAPYFSNNEMWSGRIAADLSLFDDAWTHQLFATRASRDFFDHSLDFDTFMITDSKLIDETTTYGYKSTVRIGPKDGGPVRHFVTGLIEWRDETFDQPTSGNFHAERSRLSYVGEVRGEYFGIVGLGASLRRDDNEVFDDTTDWRVDGSLKVPSTPFRLHASYGTGTKLPSFAELYGKFSRYEANENLKPESSKGWDAGIETTLLNGRAIIDVTYFNADLTNEITEDFSAYPIIRPINLDGESSRQGIEVSGRVAVMKGFTVGVAYTWLDAKDDMGKQELRRPEHQARFDVDWQSADKRGRLNLSAIYNGSMPDYASAVVGYGTYNGYPYGIYSNETKYLDSYWLVRLAGSYEMAPGVEATARVENLLDQDYQETFGYETAGLAAYAGLRFKLEAPVLRPEPWK